MLNFYLADLKKNKQREDPATSQTLLLSFAPYPGIRLISCEAQCRSYLNLLHLTLFCAAFAHGKLKNTMLSHFAKTLLRSSSPLVRSYSITTVLKAQLPSSVVVLEYKYGPRMLERREPYHQGHLFLAQEMIEQGTCLAGGPVAPHSALGYDGSGGEEPTGAFFWFTTLEAAQEFLEKDPYAQANLVTNYSIYDWTVAVSK
jgi:uncharacterized protein YciI